MKQAVETYERIISVYSEGVFPLTWSWAEWRGVEYELVNYNAQNHYSAPSSLFTYFILKSAQLRSDPVTLFPVTRSRD